MTVSRLDCPRVRTALRAGKLHPREESHLFGCADCRLEARIAAAWKAMPRSETLEPRQPADERFVAAVLAQVRGERRRQWRSRLGLAAAAAVLFFFAAGVSRRLSADRASAAEETYSQILMPGIDAYLR